MNNQAITGSDGKNSGQPNENNQQEIKNRRQLGEEAGTTRYQPPHRQLDSLRTLYKIGNGPSSSHTMGPKNAALDFALYTTNAAFYQVVLYGSLALTGKGHKTDVAILSVLPPANTEIVWDKEHRLKMHTNGLKFTAYDQQKKIILEKVYYSVGGGIIEHGGPSDCLPGNIVGINDDIMEVPRQEKVETPLYSPLSYFHEFAKECLNDKKMLNKLVYQYENREILKKNNVPEDQHYLFYSSDYPRKQPFSDQLIQSYLLKCWEVMKACIEDGLTKTENIVCEVKNDRKLQFKRLAYHYYQDALKLRQDSARRDMLLIQAFATAVSEQNGSASHNVVTTPTCGACGVLPGLLYFYYYKMPKSLKSLKNKVDGIFIDALAIAGVIGNVCRANASISGAEAGCQAEIGVAEAMAAAAASYVEMKLSENAKQITNKMALSNIEWAARNSLKNKLGLTCDPAEGLVIDPCIQRNGASALSAYNSALISISGVYETNTSLDMIISVMYQTGKDLNVKYKESAQGGIALYYYMDAIDNRDPDYKNGGNYKDIEGEIID